MRNVCLKINYECDNVGDDEEDFLMAQETHTGIPLLLK